MEKTKSYGEFIKILVKLSFSLVVLEVLSFFIYQFYFEEKFNIDNKIRFTLSDWQKKKILEFSNDQMDFRNFDSHLGWKNRPNQKTNINNQNNEPIIYSINSSGFRGIREYEKGKPTNVSRTLAIGDSFVFGSEVDDSKCWANILEEKNPNLEVLNAGVPGYGLDQSLLSFEKLSEDWYPDRVIICYMTMQLQRHVVSWQGFGSRRSVPCSKPRFILEKDELELCPNPLHSKDQYRDMLLNPSTILPILGKHDYFYLKDNIKLIERYGNFFKLLSYVPNKINQVSKDESFYKNGHYNTDNEAYRLTVEIISTFIEKANAKKIEPLLVVFPTRIDLKRLEKVQDYKVYQPLLDYLEMHKITFIDMAEVLQIHKTELLFQKNGHYSNLGNQIVAEKLSTFY